VARPIRRVRVDAIRSGASPRRPERLSTCFHGASSESKRGGIRNGPGFPSSSRISAFSGLAKHRRRSARRKRSRPEFWSPALSIRGSRYSPDCIGFFRRRTPGPSPFSSMKITPAVLRAFCTRNSVSDLTRTRSELAASILRIVLTLTSDFWASSACSIPMSARAALIWFPLTAIWFRHLISWLTEPCQFCRV
jgi:hypothetical protein